jgi:thiol-disulfide isomerase/thioredoxin
MNKTLWVVLAAVIILGGGIAFYANQNSADKDQVKNDAMMKNEDAIQKEETMSKDEGMMNKTEESIIENKDAMTKDESAMTKENENSMMEKPGSYIDYSPAALAEATKNGKAVLFFWASWCPFCKTANEAFMSRASEIPSGITILKTNYDTEKELKTKYGITYQHTFVQVDAEGKMLTKWNGEDIDALKANIK